MAVAWDGMVPDAPGVLWPAEALPEICRWRMEMMERHPSLAWLRAEDELELRRGVGTRLPPVVGRGV